MDRTRVKNAMITLAVGLALNIGLGIAKLVAGIFENSTAVTSDALNNLSDAAVSIVTIIAVALAARGADREHPFGHGRYEYIATFILGAVILVVGVEAFSSGIRRAVYPERTDVGIITLVTLGVAVAVKLFMAVFYFVRGKREDAEAIGAAAVDSASDAAVTSAVLVCALIEKYTGFLIDGYAAVAVSAVIIVFGIRIVKRTISRLLGERPDKTLYDAVMNVLTAEQSVLSVHDLIINDYGAENKIAEADAVFPAEMTFVEVHSVCDRLERTVREATGVRLCLHADPLENDDERLSQLRARLAETLTAFGATAHDISIDDDKNTVEFDILLPDGKAPTAEIVAQAEAQARSVLPYAVNIRVDYI